LRHNVLHSRIMPSILHVAV